MKKDIINHLTKIYDTFQCDRLAGKGFTDELMKEINAQVKKRGKKRVLSDFLERV